MRTPEFWYRPPGAAAWLLEPLGRIYALGTRLVLAAGRPYRARIPVISVGNLVAGGAGKTPVALALIDRLRRAGHQPVCLTRGHGGRLAGPVRVDPAAHDAGLVGDEPLLLAAAAPTWVSRRRDAGAMAIASAGLGDVLILDDAHQNPQVAQDLRLVVVDAASGFGNGRCIPAGPLREPVESGLARADAIVLVADPPALAAPPPEGLPAAVPVLRAERAVALPAGLEPRARVVGLAGIARPERFRASLERLGLDVVAFHPRGDHQPLGSAEARRLVAEAAAAGAILVTTAKDSVRWPAEVTPRPLTVPMTVTFAQPDALDALLAPLFAAPAFPAGPA